MGSMLEALEPGVTWYYNWGNTPGKGYQSQVINFEGIEYVPMCWNDRYDAKAIREYCQSHPEVKYLLGFNEPNFTKQANMTPQAAAEAWPAVQALAKELNLKLVAPALNYSPNPPYTDPLKWMDEFVALVGLDAFDFTAVHNYGGLDVMKRIAGDFHDRYGKDVWVTEFCYWPNEGDPNSTVQPEVQISSMTSSLEWLESTPWIFRYAWFKPIGKSSDAKSPNYGLLIQPSVGTDPWTLSEQGYVYTYMSEFKADECLDTESIHSSTSYFRSMGLGLGHTADAEAPVPIHISNLSSGAWADYRFDVPRGGDWWLEVRVGGFGEPVRFDPDLKIALADEEGVETEVLAAPGAFTLPNSNTDFQTHTFKLSLPAGQNIIRIADNSPFRPSGINISTIRLSASDSEVAEVSADSDIVDVYSPQGICLRRDVGRSEALHTLPQGLYILSSGEKVIK